jgi:hypothetical protein
LFGNNILNKGSICAPCLKTFIKAAALNRSAHLGLPLCFFSKAAPVGNIFKQGGGSQRLGENLTCHVYFRNILINSCFDNFLFLILNTIYIVYF